MKTVYRIYPPVGIARIGNSETAYILGSESPGIVPERPYRDNSSPGKIKPQAVRFRIYKFIRDEFGKETLDSEIVLDEKTKITWSVHLVNSKAAGGNFPPGGPSSSRRNDEYDRAGLIVDASLQSISGKNQAIGPLSGEVNFIKNGNVEGSAKVALGRLLTDEDGRLIVVGGPGKSGSPIGRSLDNFANNDGWYDGVSDGPVSAVVEVEGEMPGSAEGGAWVVVAPPSYAPGIENVTTWYDQALNVAVRNFSPRLIKDVPSFTRDIYPILKRVVMIHWVAEQRNRHHGDAGNFLNPARLGKLADKTESGKSARETVLKWLTKPNTRVDPNTPPRQLPPSMPKVNSGVDPDNPEQGEYTALTEYQYAMMEKWSRGDFEADWTAEPVPVPFDELPLEQRPNALTRASLEGCIGAPFFPGIEVTYVIAQAATYEAPFRVKHTLPAGFLTERMALPWQADFLACGELWWPAQRPVDVVTASGQIQPFSRGIEDYGDMVRWWTELGFVVKKGERFVEDERNSIDGQP
ncbi:MAG: LodA/GoxA family CTQ-dependent oxidase [Pseudomonadota bacterium]|nr:LodA/GoxA family CTQ-dependent oxidase [Pseudomonadota bacterium]